MDKKYETVTRIMGGNEGKKEIESPEMNVKGIGYYELFTCGVGVKSKSFGIVWWCGLFSYLVKIPLLLL